MTSQTVGPARPIRVLALAVVPAALCVASPAFAETKVGLDVSGSAAVATNQDLRDDADAGVSGAVTVAPWLRIEDDLTRVGLLGNIQLEKYSNRDDANISGWVSLDASRRLSSHVTIGGSLAYRRTSRILDDFLARIGAATAGGDGGTSGVILPTAPLPTAPLLDASVGALGARNESYEANVNMSVVPSARGQLTMGLGIRAARYDSATVSGLNAYSASMAYSHSLSERTSLNADVLFGRDDFRGTRTGDGWTLSPRVGASHRLGETLTLTGSVGVSLSRSRRPDGSIRGFTTFAGQLSLCKTADRTKYCLSAERSAETTALGGASVSNKIRLNFARAMGEWNELTADVYYTRYGSPTVSTAVGRVSEFVGASTTYTHTFSGRRLSAFATPSFIRLQDGSGAKTNFEVRVGLRYSFGDRS